MARIQKKKTPDKKKRPDSDDSRAVSGSAEAAGALKKSENGAPNGSGGDNKKKKAPLLISRASGTEPSAIMKMIDRYFGTWIQFFREVRFELEKVAWPTRKQTIGSTAVVLVFVFILALFLGVVDMGLSSIIRLIL